MSLVPETASLLSFLPTQYQVVLSQMLWALLWCGARADVKPVVGNSGVYVVSTEAIKESRHQKTIQH